MCIMIVVSSFNGYRIYFVVVSYNFKYSNEKIQKLIEEKLICNYKYNLIIGFDHKYIE